MPELEGVADFVRGDGLDVVMPEAPVVDHFTAVLNRMSVSTGLPSASKAMKVQASASLQC